MIESFTGRKILVVGGSRGIGRELSLLLASTGAELVIHGGHDSEAFSHLIEDIKKKSTAPIHKIIYEINSERFSDLLKSPLNDFAETADIVCVCYGPFLQKPLDAMTADDWSHIALMDYALPGFFVSRALPFMMKNHWGRFLLFGGTGTAHRTEFLTNAAYAGAKTAVGTLVESVSARYAPFGITCNALLPGFIANNELPATVSSEIGSHPLVSASAVAHAGLYLLQNNELSGVLLRADKGWSPLAEKTETENTVLRI